jgi:lysophospholipase L1-like esterase
VPRRGPWTSNVVATFLGLTMATILVGAAEFGFRHARTGTFDLPAPTWVSDPDLIYKLNPASPDSPGSFRGRAPDPHAPERPRIVCVGGSTTYGHGVGWAQAWPALLEGALRTRGVSAEVINAGVPGYGSRQILRRYRRDIAGLRPDAVVFYEGWNRTGALVDPAGWTPYATPRPETPAAQRLRMWIARHSLLVQEAAARSGSGRPATAWEARPVDPYHDVFVSDVTTLVRGVLADGHRVVLVVYPALHPREVGVELRRKHAALRQVAASTGAAIVDAAEAFDGSTYVEREALFLDVAHLSASGNRVMADVLGDRLAPLLRGP